MSRTLGTIKVAANVGRTLGVKTTRFASLFVIYRTIECIAKEALFCRKYDEQENQDYKKRDCYSSDCRGSHSILELYLMINYIHRSKSVKYSNREWPTVETHPLW